MTALLGLSFGYHDAAAAVIIDGEVQAAAQTERFSRKKNDPSFPSAAIDFCLKATGLEPADLDRVVYYEDPYAKLDRIFATLEHFPESSRKSVLANLFKDRKFDVPAFIAERLRIPRPKVSYVSHHLSHAAASFFCSPFDEAAILTMDGIGEWETASFSIGRGVIIEKLRSISFPTSLGLLYSAYTAFLGFEINEGEYKVMGMAAFGEPNCLDQVAQTFWLDGSGNLQVDQSFFNFQNPTILPFSDKFVETFGPPRVAESAFEIDDVSSPHRAISRRYANIAASLQRHVEEIILGLARAALGMTGAKALCLGGGVALNSLANGRIERELGVPIFANPGAGDCGSAIGAALAYHYMNAPGSARRPPLRHAYLGADYQDAEIQQALEAYGLKPTIVCDSDRDLTHRTAEMVSRGKVVGWMQGRFEFGPRALGHRSILANPTLAEMKAVVNQKIKFREPFRPFAPAVPVEHFNDFFAEKSFSDDPTVEDFMLSVSPVRADKRSVIPAVTHADGTARVQIVRREVEPLFHALIEQFGVITGVPVILNTSFNIRGEPIVASPQDALHTFLWSGLDAVVIGRTIVVKP